MANEAKPLFRPGAEVTIRATTSISGGRFVDVIADYDGNFPCSHSALGAKPFGVAAADISAGQLGAIHRGGIIPVTAGGTIAVGDEVQSDDQGRAVTRTTGRLAGTAVAPGVSGLPVPIALRIAS